MEQMFRRTAQQALEQLDTTTQGLSDAEIAKRRETYGENALAEEKKKSPLVVFLEQFKDLLVIILIAAAVISALSGNGESTIVIVAVITLNAILGTAPGCGLRPGGRRGRRSGPSPLHRPIGCDRMKKTM